MFPSALCSSCFISTLGGAGLDEEGQEEDESEVFDLGEEGFSSFILATGASVSLAFVVSLLVSIGSRQSDTGGGTGEHGPKPLTDSFDGSTSVLTVAACSS